MRRVPIDHPSMDGAVLVRDVRGVRGEILARAGMRLSARAARALRERGVAVAFIEDAASAGLDVRPLVDAYGSDEVLARALRDTCRIAMRSVAPLARQPTSRALVELKDVRFVQTLETTGVLETLRAAVHQLVERASTADPDTGFLSDRHPADDLVGHSLGVAALSVRIAADLGFEYNDLAWTGLSAVLHDIGLLMVPESVRRAPAHLRTPGEQRRYQDHTLLGAALLKPLAWRARVFPLVALEHHEEQSGGGYPHALTGGNRVLRSATLETPRMALVSEVIAVADRYERLVAGAPGEAPRSAAAARHIIADEAGAKLNAEVVGRFVDLLPRYPLGTEVVLHGDECEGARAVVVQQGAHRGRPHVRIYATPDGSVSPTIVVLDEYPAASITAADEALAA